MNFVSVGNVASVTRGKTKGKAMNTDIRISVSFKGHRKRKKLRRILGDKSDSYLIDFWITVSTDCPNGILKGWNNDDIADACCWEGDPDKIANAFIDSGWVDIDSEGVYSVHDWDKHQAWACNAEKRSEAARVAARKRWDKKDADIMQSACGTHKDGNAPLLSSPILPLPDPKPSQDKIHMPSAKIVITKLNELANKKFRFGDTNTKHIIARLKDGFTEADCLKVLETKIQDPHFISNPQHYNPETLFRPSKFEKYLNEDPENYPKPTGMKKNGFGEEGYYQPSSTGDRNEKF